MTRLSHGEIGSSDPSDDEGFERFGLLFPELQKDSANLLPESPATVVALKKLAETMIDFDTVGNDSPIPAAYTYFGQFVDHDITMETMSGPATEGAGGILAPDVTPIPLDDIANVLRNKRSAVLDLDSLYAPPAPRDPANPAKLLLGNVSELGNQEPPSARPAGKGVDNDLPREPRTSDPAHDRAALIGDPRNDENTVISQLHVAFLKAHNRLVDEGHDFDAARRILRRHYQSIVVHDFLMRIADPAVVRNVLDHGNAWYDPFAEPFHLPLEFTVAAFRFGHTMVRPNYDFNINFHATEDGSASPASLDQLFTFSALSGQLGFAGGPNDPSELGEGTLPENWIIEWERLAGDDLTPRGRARRLDTRLASVEFGARAGLFNLRTPNGTPEKGLAAMLSARNLLRGYRLRMPTGQTVANHLGVPVLDADHMRAAVGTRQAAELAAAGFLEHTPLWFYVLAEAASRGGDRLGPVGSTILAEVLIGLVRRSPDSILQAPGWTPSLPRRHPDRFELADLLRYAGVLTGVPPTTTYRVQSGDTIQSIALNLLGDADRWTEIFAANRNIVSNPDDIFGRFGRIIIVPTGPPAVPRPRFHVVAAGETCETIAATELGDPDRWREILDRNGDTITNPDVLRAGVTLALPPS
jgi:nucleoid-associated protein YgaU